MNLNIRPMSCVNKNSFDALKIRSNHRLLFANALTEHSVQSISISYKIYFRKSFKFILDLGLSRGIMWFESSHSSFLFVFAAIENIDLWMCALRSCVGT